MMTERDKTVLAAVAIAAGVAAVLTVVAVLIFAPP
jgi:hypothetical protein